MNWIQKLYLSTLLIYELIIILKRSPQDMSFTNLKKVENENKAFLNVSFLNRVLSRVIKSI